MTLTGTGTIEISINNYAQFQVDIGENVYITVDSMIEECYKDGPLTLKNSNMSGEFPVLQPGENRVTWTGTPTKIKIHPMSRWL